MALNISEASRSSYIKLAKEHSVWLERTHTWRPVCPALKPVRDYVKTADELTYGRSQSGMNSSSCWSINPHLSGHLWLVIQLWGPSCCLWSKQRRPQDEHLEPHSWTDRRRSLARLSNVRNRAKTSEFSPNREVFDFNQVNTCLMRPSARACR
jgi:hypothetical protein